MRIPAKIRPPKQMTAPAKIAKVLKVVISVVAPEKSIVPWAWAMLVTVNAASAGHITRAARNSLRFEKGRANRLARRAVLRENTTWLLRIIGTSIDWSQSGMS